MHDKELASLMAELVPDVYAETASALLAEGWRGLSADPSHSNRCGEMTLALFAALQQRGLPCRREFHKIQGVMGHFMIVHALANEVPSDDDLITDLNPWQHGPSKQRGFLHGKRSEVQQALLRVGAPHISYELRGVGTIAIRHTMVESVVSAQE